MLKSLIRNTLKIALLTLAAAGAAHAQDNKSMRLLVGFSAGGGTDQVARLFANALQEELKQTVIVENRTGANGVIAIQELIKSPPDGNTIMITINSLVTNELMYKELPYTVKNDITPISLVSTVPFVLTANQNFPAKSVAELIAHAKANPGKVTYGSAGVGSPPHLFQELFDQMAGIQTTHVPYRGSGPAVADLLGGHIDLIWLTTLQAMPHLKEGRLHSFALSSRERSDAVPDIPTLDEEGVKGYAADMWWGFVGPSGMPEDTLRKLEQAFRNVVASREIQEKLAELGSVPQGTTSEEFSAILTEENSKWEPLIRSLGISLDK